MKKGTVSQSFDLGGLDNYWAIRSGAGEISFSPAELGQGILFEDPVTGEQTQMNQHTLEFSTAGTARFMSLQAGKTRFKVIEHLVSALVLSQITDVIVKPEKGFRGYTPVVGPGIEPLYSTLIANRHCFEVNQVLQQVESSDSFTAEYKGEEARLSVAPAEKFNLSIASYHPDLVDLESVPLDVPNFYNGVASHLEARPVARIQKGLEAYLYPLLKSCLKGISPKTYLMALSGDTADDIVAHMAPEYREGRNEHYAHTASSDLPAELYAHFPGEFRGNLEFSGRSNHKTRMDLLKQLKASGIVSSTNQ